MRGVPAPTPSARTCRRAALIAVALAAILDSPAMAAEPKPSPQRLIPAREIIGYIEFDGLAAHANAWEATAAYAMLAKTPAGGMMTEVARQVADRLLLRCRLLVPLSTLFRPVSHRRRAGPPVRKRNCDRKRATRASPRRSRSIRRRPSAWTG